MNREVFEAYLQMRLERAGALTPGQKLAVVEELIREAREEGRIPVAPDRVIALPTESPSVQAVLEGKPVSLAGGGAVQPQMDARQRIQALPLPVRMGALALVALLLFVVFVAGARRVLGGRADAAPGVQPLGTPTAQVTVTESVVLNDTPPERNPQPSDPASLEVGGQAFVLGAGSVRRGVWEPSGPEWLADTLVRRVVALPLDQVQATFGVGDMIRLRTRAGDIVPYRIVQVANVRRTQIEVLTSTEPSLLIILYDDTQASRRTIVLATLDLPPVATPTPRLAVVSSPVGRANLRSEPSASGSVLAVLENGVSVEVLDDPVVHNDGYDWQRVRIGGMEGWMAAMLLTTP